MANAHEALGQHVQKEAAQELGGSERHLALLAAVGVVLPAEGDALAVEGQQTVIGDGHAMGVAAEITQHLHGSAEGGLGIDHPVVAMQAAESWANCFGSARGAADRRSELLAAVQTLQTGEELAAEDAAEDLHRQEERIAWANPTACGPATDRPPESRSGRADAAAGSVPRYAEC